MTLRQIVSWSIASRSRVRCPGMDSPAKGRQGQTEESPVKGPKDKRIGVPGKSRLGGGGGGGMCVNTWSGSAEMKEPVCLQWCPVTEQEETGTNWNTGGSLYTSENQFSLWALVAQGGLVVSHHLGDTQTLLRHTHGQPPLGDSAWATG